MRVRIFTCLLGIFMCANAFASAPYRVAILMFDDVQIIDFAAPYEVFGQAKFEVFTVSPDGKPVETVMGLNVTPDHSFASMPDVDAIVVPGGTVDEAMENKQILSWLDQQQSLAEHILSVCTGSFILAESSLLDGKSATTFHRAINGFESAYSDIEVLRDQRFVDNGQIITSAGLSSGIDAALHLVSRVRGLDTAKTVAMHLEYDWQPEGGFVRAMMADKMMPNLDYDWPSDTKFERLSSYGSETEWQITYQVSSPSALSELVKTYKKIIKNDADWSLAQSNQSGILRWTGKHEAQGWLHSLHFSEKESDNTYKLRLTVQQISG